MGSITLGSHPGGVRRPNWVKSSLSFANGNCVEVAQFVGGEVGVRNSRQPEGPVLRFTADEWHAFIGGAHQGEFDGFGGLSARRRHNGAVSNGGFPATCREPSVRMFGAQGPSPGQR